jgi:hypothetical protein
MGEACPAGSESIKQGGDHVAFLNREAVEVYLLLDFLSGRTDRSLRPTQGELAHTVLDQHSRSNPSPSPDEQQRREIEDDLNDPTRLILRTMRIKYPLERSDKTFQADATFLMRARDVLNTRASPASGLTIAFTSMVSGGRSGLSEFARVAYPQYEEAAKLLAKSIVFMLRMLAILLIVALTVSAYAAWGKVLLDTLDAVRRDDGATQKELSAARTASQLDLICADPKAAPPVCKRGDDIKIRYNVTSYQLAMWEPPSWLHSVSPQDEESSAEQKRTEQWATAAMAVVSNYIMPVLYGLLGSMAFVLRRHYDRLAAQLLLPRDRRANSIRLALGVVIGGCIGLIYSGSSVAQTTGLLGAAATLSTAAIAFLAGYGVEGVFNALDALITQVFRVSSTDKPPQPAA